MVHKQIDQTYKILLFVYVPATIATSSLLLTNETVRFWFTLYCVVLLGRWLCAAVAYYFLLPVLLKRGRISSENKAVLVTSCDTQFGDLLVKKLVHLGFYVFAGTSCPADENIQKLILSCPSNLTILKIDVTDSNSIEGARYSVETLIGQLDLWAVVNNSGVSGDASIEDSAMKTFEEMLDVNVLGVIRVTKTFLPLLIKARGRVINMASALGRLTLPGSAAYSISRRGTIAFSDILRDEVNEHGVAVVTIEPYFSSNQWLEQRVTTCLADKSSAIQEGKPSEDAAKKDFRVIPIPPSMHVTENLEKVVNTIVCAVMQEVPEYKYCCGSWWLKYVFWYLQYLVELEMFGDFSFSRGFWRNPFLNKY